MSDLLWSISGEVVSELIELALDGQMTVETFTELSKHLDETWEEQVEKSSRIPFVIECKTNDVTAYLTGSSNSKKRHLTLIQTGAVVHKKHGVTDGAEQYATMPLYMLVTLLKEAGYAVHEEDSATD